MFLTEYNEEKAKEMEREEGRKEGEENRSKEIASTMLKEGGMTLSYILRE